MTENLIIFNARVVTPIGFSACCGKEMGELCIIEFWSSRDLCTVLGYSTYQKFSRVIDIAIAIFNTILPINEIITH